MIFETFCRIHQCISIEMLAQKLNMKPTEAERWIVNLIRQAKLDAKIDSQQGKLEFRLTDRLGGLEAWRPTHFSSYVPD